MCRSLPPAMLFSVSPIEKADAQIPFTRGREVPETDAQPVVIFHAKPDTDTHREKI
jgi:hypothetical protein